MRTTKISTGFTLNLALVDDNGAPVTAWTYAAGDIKYLAPGATAWVNVAGTPAQTTSGNSRGDWQIAIANGEVGAAAGELLVLVYKAGVIAMRRRAIEVVAALPGEVTSIAANAITATSINAAAITSAKFATGAIDANAIADGAIDAGAIADGSIIASKIGGNAITSAKIAAGALTSNAFATDAIDANAVAASAIAEWPTNATITTAVVAGMAGSPVGSVTGAVGSVTAIAADAITGTAVAASAVTKIQSGLATASAVTSVQDDTNDLQARLPAALVGGRLDAYVGAMGSNVVTSTALDATAATEIATAVGAPSAATISTQVAADLATAHGAGSWEGASSGGATASEIADAVLDEALAGHATAGTVGAALSGAATASALSTLATAVGNLPSAATIATAVWAVVVEGAHTTAGALRVMLRVLAGRRIVSGTTDTYRNLANTRNTVVATVDTDGNRSAASTLDSDP